MLYKPYRTEKLTVLWKKCIAKWILRTFNVKGGERVKRLNVPCPINKTKSL